jgi:hypothetical protein
MYFMLPNFYCYPKVFKLEYTLFRNVFSCSVAFKAAAFFPNIHPSLSIPAVALMKRVMLLPALAFVHRAG